MIRFVFRVAAVILLMIAVLYGVIDSAISVGASDWQYTSLVAAWDGAMEMLPLNKFGGHDMFTHVSSEDGVWLELWNRIAPLPVWGVLLVASFLLYAIGFKRQKRKV